MNESSFIARLHSILSFGKGFRFVRGNNGGEDRTRTCKRFRAVVFKTTALPIRLPLHLAVRIAASASNCKYIAECLICTTDTHLSKKKPGHYRTAGKREKD